MKRFVFGILLFMVVFCAVVTASPHSDAQATSSQLATDLQGKLPLSKSLDTTQLKSVGYDADNMTHPKSVYKFDIKSSKYDPSSGQTILFLNGYRDGKSLRVNNPVRFYLPFSNAALGTTESERLATFELLIVRYLDELPLGEPVNDDTLVAYGNNDADFYSNTNSTWSTHRNASGNGVDHNNHLYLNHLKAGTTDGYYDLNYRGAVTFNTSSMGSGASAASAIVRFQYHSKASTLIGTNETALVAGNVSTYFLTDDYDSMNLATPTELSPRYDFTSASGNINFTLNAAGLSNINTSGFSSFYTIDGDELDNSFSGVWGSAKARSLRVYGSTEPTVSRRPFIQIVYTPFSPDTTPPLSITGLTNTTTNCNNITFSWTNPTDTDYDGLMLWRNNTALSNLTNSSTSVLWEGLPENTDITISTKTFDLSQNVNATFVNLTKKTNVCFVPTPTPTTTTAAYADWAWCANQDIFFRNDSSDISGYKIMDHRPEIAVQSVVSQSVSSSTGDKTLGTWATPVGSPGVSVLAPGLWRFRIYAFSGSDSGNNAIKFHVYNRSASGTETHLFYGTAITEDIVRGTAPSEYLLSYARRNYTTMFPGDRLVIRANASTDGAAERAITMELAGNTNASMVSVSYFICPESSTSGVMVPNEIPLPLPIILLAILASVFIIRRKGGEGRM